MKKISDTLYLHRGRLILKDEQGIYVEHHLHLFKTWTDAREFINQILDGTNKKTPVIIGEWKAVEVVNASNADYGESHHHWLM